MQFVEALPPEEAARANFYALLARLFYAPPDEPLLRSIAGTREADEEDGGIGRAWRELAEAAVSADAEAVREEYDCAFVGTGKSPVTLYTCAYSVRYTNEAPLVELRRELSALGLAKREGAGEPEDHVAALCEVMRHLVSERSADLALQKHFFERWMWPTAEPLCNAIQRSELTRFYKRVAALLLELCTLEHAAFEML